MSAARSGRAGLAPWCLVVAGTLLPTSAPAETVNCAAITSAPVTISAPGIYCLTADLNTNLASGYAISITANSVVLDLNGHKIGNLSAGLGTTAAGIYAFQRQNVTIRNGTVRGFQYGIYLADNFPYTTSQGHLIERIRADQNTFEGITVVGRASIVRKSQVVATGGSTAVPPNSGAYAIYLLGPGNCAIDNDVILVTTPDMGTPFGIYFGSNDPGLAIGNRISNTTIGIEMFSSPIKYRDNLTTGIAGFRFQGGIDAGNNN